MKAVAEAAAEEEEQMEEKISKADHALLAAEMVDGSDDDVPLGDKPRLQVEAEAAAAAGPALPTSVAKYMARRAAVRTLLKLHQHLSNAIACMLCCSLDQLPDVIDGDEAADVDAAHDNLITVYEQEIRRFHEVLVDEWRPDKVGLVLSQSGHNLVNWPLHCMSHHVPDQVPSPPRTTHHAPCVVSKRPLCFL